MILIVDDREENLFSLRRTLELNGFSVDTAESGEDALKKILKQSYSLIILDVQMPGMDGFEVAENIAGFSKSKNIPIIFLSAVNVEKRFISKGYNSGGIDYITKPVDPDILIYKVRTFYRLSQQAKELNEIHNTLREEIETRKRTEDALKLIVEEQHVILETIPQIAFMMGNDGHIEYVNEQWFHYSRSKDTLPQMHEDNSELREKIDEALQSTEPLIAEVRLRKLSEDKYEYFLLKMIPVLTEKTPVKWVGTFTNINEQKRTSEILEQRVNERTQELIESNKELEATNYDLQQFTFVASHDLKEPLRKIQVFSSLLGDKDLGDPEVNRFVQRIIDSTKRMTGLINDLLSYSTISSQELFKATDLNDIVTNVLQDLEIAIAEKNVLIKVENLPVADVIAGQMRQVFQNIISNAIKFSKTDVAPEIVIGSERISKKGFNAPADDKGMYYKITIKDNGIGFNEKYLDKIFTIFQQLNLRDEYQGTGIGLAIVKRIIEKHDGIITAIGKEGVGATFVIVLPLKQEKIYLIEGKEQKNKQNNTAYSNK